jgi:tRNA (cytidine/uridine-2'-O-)-methyltransferase
VGPVLIQVKYKLQKPGPATSQIQITKAWPRHGDREPWLVTRHGGIRYDKPEYQDEDVLVFGSETKRLPQSWIDRWPRRTVYVPILGKIRNYNLANTVSVVLAHASLKAGIYDSIK